MTGGSAQGKGSGPAQPEPAVGVEFSTRSTRRGVVSIEMATLVPLLFRRREELERDSIRVSEGNTRAVIGVLDFAVLDAKLVQTRGPCL